ncbi:GNAT family N-acetyltransferase [Lysobacter sp. CCNWLW3]|uniref:GNAT family N-acetyltransferase n=1 Tax=unclassified Lysobacter TaxID=2635362 RepID=UPI002FD67CCE
MSHDLRLRPCVAGDEAALALLGQATFLETFAGILGGGDIVQHCQRAHAASVYRAWLEDPACALWLAEIAPGDAPVGYAVVAPAQLPLDDLDARDLELKRIYLLSRFHGGGWGKRLLEAAVAHARAAGAPRLLLGVYAGNTAAIGFYERCGFRALGTRRFNVGGRDYDDRILGLALD